MYHQHDNSTSTMTLRSLIQTYEALTGLIMACMSQNDDSRWIDWAYSDGSWAGTTSYDRSIDRTIEKLEREIEEQRQRLEAHYPLPVYDTLESIQLSA